MGSTNLLLIWTGKFDVDTRIGKYQCGSAMLNRAFDPAIFCSFACMVQEAV